MSDQDFFFDEDEKPAPKAEKAAKPAAKGSASNKSAKSSKAGSQQQSSSGIELTWTITALIGVVTLLLGVIIGYALPKTADVDTGVTGTGTQMQAPQLSPEEMQSGELPEGHPDIGSMGSGAATGSAETTSGN